MTVFKKIIDREIPADIVFENEYVLAFKDIDPVAPVHILIIPKKEIPTINDVEDEDALALGHLFLAAKKIAREQGIADDGYRVIVNVNHHGGQEVYHLHMHLVGGRRLGRMIAKPN
jgi:histidine triad (HIT) family protein